MEIQMDESLLMLNRFFSGGGWLQIGILAVYGGILMYNMQDAAKSAKWRKRSWLAFSIVFFTQFILGLLADERFLMSGMLHVPVPFMIVAGPVYRAQMTIMPILLMSSIILTGPAWCSHYCYFGAWDQVIAQKKTKRGGGQIGTKEMRIPIRNKWMWKWTFLVLLMVFAIAFRWLNFYGLQTLIPALLLAGIGLAIMIFISRRKKKMVHCTTFCPIGTLVNLAKIVSPFRMKIESSCTNCMRCIPSCQYDALNGDDIKARKPGLNCTLCGDCVTTCEVSAIQYRFLRLSPAVARNLYLFLTIALHVLCMGLARI